MSKLFFGRYELQKRLHIDLRTQAIATILALIAAFAISAVLIAIAGANPIAAYQALFHGAFGSTAAILETLVKATPLIFTSLAVVVTFRAKIWNIGAQGQFYGGAIGAYLAYSFVIDFSAWIVFPAITLGAILGGGLFGALAGYLKARFAVSEVLSTVMLNYVMHYLVSYLLLNVWRDPSSVYQQTPMITGNATLPLLVTDSRLHIGILLAILMAVLVYVLMKKTYLGYRIRAIGLNPKAARFKGISPGRIGVVVMFLGGALAGLGGAVEVFGLVYRVKGDISGNVGFQGIICAMIAGLNPLAVVPVAILF